MGIPTLIVTGNIFFHAYATTTLIGSTGGIVAENGGIISETDEEDIEKIKVLDDFKKVQQAFNFLNSKLEDEFIKEKSNIGEVNKKDLNINDYKLKKSR